MEEKWTVIFIRTMKKKSFHYSKLFKLFISFYFVSVIHQKKISLLHYFFLFMHIKFLLDYIEQKKIFNEIMLLRKTYQAD